MREQSAYDEFMRLTDEALKLHDRSMAMLDEADKWLKIDKRKADELGLEAIRLGLESLELVNKGLDALKSSKA